MDKGGEPVSAPRPKDYAVSHGMCRACGSLWLEQVLSESGEPEGEQMSMIGYKVIEEEA